MVEETQQLKIQPNSICFLSGLKIKKSWKPSVRAPKNRCALPEETPLVIYGEAEFLMRAEIKSAALIRVAGFLILMRNTWVRFRALEVISPFMGRIPEKSGIRKRERAPLPCFFYGISFQIMANRPTKNYHRAKERRRRKESRRVISLWRCQVRTRLSKPADQWSQNLNYTSLRHLNCKITDFQPA